MIICAGESLVDVLPPVVENGEAQVVPGGGPMNAAVAAARLGAPTAFVGRVSTDPYGDLIWDHLLASGVDLRAAQRGGEPTARAIVTVAPVQGFRFEGENTADASMTEVDVSPLGEQAALLHAGTLGVFRGDTAETLVELLDLHTGVVSFDPNIRPQVFPDRESWLAKANPWLDRADIIKVSDEDLDWIGLSAQALLDRGAAVVLRTLGGDGIETFLADGEIFTVPSSRVDVVDAVGAGDSFCGAILAQLDHAGIGSRAAIDGLGSDRWHTMVDVAAKAAAITVSRPGADPPWKHEAVGPWEESAS